MCTDCKHFEMGRVLRQIRGGKTREDFAVHINKQRRKVEKRRITNVVAWMPSNEIDDNVIARWEGTEKQAVRLPMGWGMEEMQLLAELLRLPAEVKRQYDLAVICYLVFDLDRRGRPHSVCEDLEGGDVGGGAGALVIGGLTLPQFFKSRGLNSDDVKLWEAASASANDPTSKAKLQRYMKAREIINDKSFPSLFTQSTTSWTPPETPPERKRKRGSIPKISGDSSLPKRLFRSLLTTIILSVVISVPLVITGFVGFPAQQLPAGCLITPGRVSLARTLYEKPVHPFFTSPVGRLPESTGVRATHYKMTYMGRYYFVDDGNNRGWLVGAFVDNSSGCVTVAAPGGNSTSP